MARSLQDIERDIQALEPTDRHQLIRDLIADMVDGEDAVSVERAWRAEAQRRLRELQGGSVTSVPAVEVIANARARPPRH